MLSDKTFTLTQLPFYKKIPNTNYLVDCFNISIQDDCIYFLSHFHADHYIGLSKKFASTLFCSVTTANLVIKNLRVDEKQIVKLEMHRWYKLENSRYMLLVDANHCPGAVCFVFRINGLFYLHTGDFRASKQFYDQFESLDDVEVHKIDNTVIENVGQNVFYNLHEKIDTLKTVERMSYKIKNECTNNKIQKTIEMISNTQNNTKNTYLHTKYAKDADTDIKTYMQDSVNDNIIVNNNYDIYCDVKKVHINKIHAHLSKITHDDVVKATKNYTLMSIKYNNVFLDNTYEHYKFFDTQENIIHRILNIIDKKKKGCLAPVDYKYLFATYSVGKEKVFLCVAEHLDCFVQVEKRKMDLYMCLDSYTTKQIDKEVKNIVKNYKESNKTKNDVRHYLKPIKNNNKHDESTTTEKVKERNITCNDVNNVFSKVTEKKHKNSIELISMMHVNKNKIQQICKKYNNDRICIFVGSGWNEKTIYYDFEKENGRIVKKGIEVHYLPYSEHSSDAELNEFRQKVNCKNIVNTVKNTWNVNESLFE
ncbi:DNA cross-link repair protein PSO2/SNM1 [Binucleata daphniae]